MAPVVDFQGTPDAAAAGTMPTGTPLEGTAEEAAAQ